MGSVILYSCINFEVGKELLPNLIAEFMGVFITYILFDLYVNRIQERKQHMLAKYLHYSKLLKHTKTFISVLKMLQEQPIQDERDQSDDMLLKNARSQFEISAYDAAPYFEEKEFYVMWPLLCDDCLTNEVIVVALQKLEKWLEQDIRSNIIYEAMI